jgi:hypothetical protein
MMQPYILLYLLCFGLSELGRTSAYNKQAIKKKGVISLRKNWRHYSLIESQHPTGKEKRNWHETNNTYVVFFLFLDDISAFDREGVSVRIFDLSKGVRCWISNLSCRE